MGDPALVKGHMAAARLAYLDQRHGPAARQRVLDALPEADRKILASVGPSDWCPLDTLLRLDHAIAEVAAPGDDAVFERLGEFSARDATEWAGKDAQLVSVHTFLALAAERHHALHSFGAAAYRMIGFWEAELSFSGYPLLDPIWCRSAVGFLRTAAAVFAGGPVAIEKRACQCRGDPACVYRLRWGEAKHP